MAEDKKDAERLAQLEAEIAALKSAMTPQPQPSREEQERADAKWQNEMHQMRERRMSMATPPEVVRDWAILDDNLCKGIRGDARVPTGSRSGMIPATQQATVVRTPSPTPGHVDPRPLTNPPGTNWVDAIAIADDVRQRAELKRKLGEP
jgi:hypothetical protein